VFFRLSGFFSLLKSREALLNKRRSGGLYEAAGNVARS
jgi:hypothetical protein